MNIRYRRNRIKGIIFQGSVFVISVLFFLPLAWPVQQQRLLMKVGKLVIVFFLSILSTIIYCNCFPKDSPNCLLNGKKIVSFSLCCISSFALGILIEFSLSHLYYGISSTGKCFNVYRYIYICCVLITIIIFFFEREIVAENPEIPFAILLLIFGISKILIFPVSHDSWDVIVHYEYALGDSYLGTAYETKADVDVVGNAGHFLIDDTANKNEKDEHILNSYDNKVVRTVHTGISLPHMPAGWFLAIGRMFKFPFTVRFKMGEIANLLLYTMLCYYSMKKLKSGKMILAIIALFPTNILVASSYSYDYWVIGFSLLGMAYFIGECQRSDKILTDTDTVIICASFTLACIPKQIYIPLLLIPFFMTRKKIKNKKKYYGICLLFFAMLGMSMFARTILETTGTGDLRGGLDVNPLGQIDFMIKNPLNYMIMLYRFVKSYLSITSLSQSITNFANVGVTDRGYLFIVLILIIAVFTDKNEKDYFVENIWLKGYVIFIYFAEAVLIATAFYIIFTPVGSNYISGCQVRYMTPLLYPMLSVIGNIKTVCGVSRKMYNTGILSICTIVFFYVEYILILKKMF